MTSMWPGRYARPILSTHRHIPSRYHYAIICKTGQVLHLLVEDYESHSEDIALNIFTQIVSWLSCAVENTMIEMSCIAMFQK